MASRNDPLSILCDRTRHVSTNYAALRRWCLKFIASCDKSLGADPIYIPARSELMKLVANCDVAFSEGEKALKDYCEKVSNA
jgi:hypothetical protein